MVRWLGSEYAHRGERVYHADTDCPEGRTIPEDLRVTGEEAQSKRSPCPQCVPKRRGLSWLGKDES